MPGWYRWTRELRDAGQLQIVGLIQEQHPERCRLFMAWKRLHFPILVDSLNRIGVYAVPMMWAIDEHGVVRATRPREDWIRDEFVSTRYPAPSEKPPGDKPGTGVEHYLRQRFDQAIAAFRAETRKESGEAEAWFRLGCALRARHDSAEGRPGDFQEAIRAWTRAIELNPRNYIFRRRLQQYGPRLDKPYPFYDWVAVARRDLAARGEEAPPLRVSLEGSEIARPARGGIVEASGEKEPDPKGAVPRDSERLVRIETAIAPAPPRAGSAAAIYLRFTPDERRDVTWDNEAGPLRVWLETETGFKLARRSLAAAMPDEPSSSERRSLEFELGIPASQKPGEGLLEGYALYYVCEGKSGSCSYLRHDFRVPVRFRPARKGRGRGRRR